jgi:hypothetical protein
MSHDVRCRFNQGLTSVPYSARAGGGTRLAFLVPAPLVNYGGAGWVKPEALAAAGERSEGLRLPSTMIFAFLGAGRSSRAGGSCLPPLSAPCLILVQHHVRLGRGTGNGFPPEFQERNFSLRIQHATVQHSFGERLGSNLECGVIGVSRQRSSKLEKRYRNDTSEVGLRHRDVPLLEPLLCFALVEPGRHRLCQLVERCFNRCRRLHRD